MVATVGKILELVEEMAPPALAESYDNIGLLCGSMTAEVSRVLVALDVSMKTIEEAKSIGAQLLITHHPILFSPARHLRDDDAQGRITCALVRSGLNHIAAHTNWDSAKGGTSDCLAKAFDLLDVQEDGYVRAGKLAGGMTLAQLSEKCTCVLGEAPRLIGPMQTMIHTLAVGPGACGEFYPAASRLGAQAYLVGEMKHHEILYAREDGLCLLEAGHYATENISMPVLAEGLQSRLDAIQYRVQVVMSQQQGMTRGG